MERIEFKAHPQSATLVDPETYAIGWLAGQAPHNIQAWLAMQTMLQEMEQRVAYIVRVEYLNRNRS